MPVREVNRLAEFKNSYPIVIKDWCTQQALVEAGIRNVKAMDDIPLSLEAEPINMHAGRTRTQNDFDSELEVSNTSKNKSMHNKFRRQDSERKEVNALLQARKETTARRATARDKVRAKNFIFC